MAEAFDPYREWLGIRETTRPLSHYQLLGVTEFEDNPLAIAVAAESAISRLKGTDPVDRRGRWQQLLDELSLARICLSDRSRKLQYDVQLRDRRGIVAPAPVQPAPTAPIQQTPAPAANADLFPPAPVHPVAPEAMPGPPMVAPSYPVQPQYTYAQTIYVAVPANQAFGVPFGVPTSYPVQGYGVPQAPFVAPSAPYIPQARPVELQPVEPVVPLSAFVEPPVEYFESPAAETTAAVADPDPVPDMAPLSFQADTAPTASGFDFPASAAPRRAARTMWSPDAKSMGIFAGVALVVLVGFVVVQSNMPKEPDKVSTLETPAAPIASPDDIKPKPVEPAKPPEPQRPKLIDEFEEPPQPKPNPPAIPKPDSESTPVAQVEEPSTEPEPEPAPPPAAQTPEQKALFEKSLKNARAAMGARKLPLAQEELKTAKANIGTADQETEVARLEELYVYVEGFWKAVVESLKGLQATDTLPIDNTEIAIVEVDDSSITIRAAGRNMSYSLEDMPSGLAMALATRWFDKSAANKLFLGAFHAVDPAGDIDDARRYWEEATQGGANAQSLMPLLDQRTAPLATEQGPVPQKALLAKARQALRASMPDEYREAKSLERKLSLARELLDMAAQNDNDVERYVLYDEALNFASDAGSAPDILSAVEGLASAYKVDAWELRAAAFSSAAGAANNPVVAKALARELIEVVDQAITEDHPKEAAKLCTAAISAAKKGKDLELVKQATERKAKLDGS